MRGIRWPSRQTSAIREYQKVPLHALIMRSGQAGAHCFKILNQINLNLFIKKKKNTAQWFWCSYVIISLCAWHDANHTYICLQIFTLENFKILQIKFLPHKNGFKQSALVLTNSESLLTLRLSHLIANINSNYLRTLIINFSNHSSI